MSDLKPNRGVALPTLRAVKRAKRPSYSPQKWAPPAPPEWPRPRSQSHGTTASSSLITSDLQDLSLTMKNPKTAALDFEEFSFIDNEGKFRCLENKWLLMLGNYLEEHYQAHSFTERLPYLVVWCYDKVPPPSERPFIIAGLVAVWLVVGKDIYPQDMDLGDESPNLEPWIRLEPELTEDLECYVIPQARTLSIIMHRHFKDAIAISYVSERIVVEFNQKPDAAYKKDLESLPFAIENTDVLLRYHNGPIQGQELKRTKLPNPTKLDGEYDDTDYVRDHGCFYPGSMLSSKNNTLISAGIMVRNKEDTRITVAIHCWDQQLNSNVKLGHSDYTVKQGEWDSGTVVGTVVERINISAGPTDIGLATVEKPFSNRFLDLDGSATSLLHSETLKRFGTTFWLDSFVTGSQQLALAGKRIISSGKRGREFFSDLKHLPQPGIYIELVQGIFATSTPEITTSPKIREGVCGAAIIRAQPKVQRKTSPPQETISGGKGSSSQVSTPETPTPRRKPLVEEETTGEVAGFMHWSDIQSIYNGDRLLCFADAVDGLIDAGWEVVPAVEKRTAMAAGLDDNDDPFLSKGSPEK